MGHKAVYCRTCKFCGKRGWSKIFFWGAQICSHICSLTI